MSKATQWRVCSKETVETLRSLFGHEKTPEGVTVIEQECEPRGDAFFNSKVVGWMEPETAELICLAVNSHASLLAACQAAIVKLEGTLPYVKEHIPRCDINAAIEELRAAIQQAGGGE